MRCSRIYLPARVSESLYCRYIYAPRRYTSTAESLPRVAQPSFWHSIVPKFLRERGKASNKIQAPILKEWNPATFYIVIFLLIGSNAIQMIALRNSFLAFSRKADAKIGLLREVIERIQKGEEVDVKGLLGTGDAKQEEEWEEVLREIEKDGPLLETKAEKREARRVKRAEQVASGAAEAEADTTSVGAIEGQEEEEAGHKQAADQTINTSKKTKRRPLAFY